MNNVLTTGGVFTEEMRKIDDNQEWGRKGVLINNQAINKNMNEEIPLVATMLDAGGKHSI